MSKGGWGDVIAWANSEIEKARTSLETADHAGDITRLQARIAVMRDLLTIKDTPIASEIPDPVGY